MRHALTKACCTDELVAREFQRPSPVNFRSRRLLTNPESTATQATHAITVTSWEAAMAGMEFYLESLISPMWISSGNAAMR
jgi:hypothetical protein